MELTGIILAGGKSSRMGRDKALMRFKNTTLLDNAIDLLQPFCSTIIISSNNKEHERKGCQRVADEIKDCGPIGGIYSCLQQSKTTWNICLPVDTPYVTPEFIAFLIKNANINGQAIVPKHNSGIEPLIALYNKSIISTLKKQINQHKLKMQNTTEEPDIQHINTTKWVLKNTNLFLNINRPKDF